MALPVKAPGSRRAPERALFPATRVVMNTTVAMVDDNIKLTAPERGLTMRFASVKGAIQQSQVRIGRSLALAVAVILAMVGCMVGTSAWVITSRELEVTSTPHILGATTNLAQAGNGELASSAGTHITTPLSALTHFFGPVDGFDWEHVRSVSIPGANGSSLSLQVSGCACRRQDRTLVC